MDRGTNVLIDCLKEDEDEAKLSRLKSYSSDQWEEAFKSAASNRLTPLFYHILKPHFDHLSQAGSIREELRSAHLSTAARNIKHYRQLLDLVKIFRAEGIPLILLKGSHLAELVYGTLALRSMFGMDLLVKAKCRRDGRRVEVDLTPC